MSCLFWLCLGLVLGVSSAGLGLLVCLCCVSFALVISIVWCALCELCLFVVGGVLFVCLCFLSVCYGVWFPIVGVLGVDLLVCLACLGFAWVWFLVWVLLGLVCWCACAVLAVL